MKTDFITAAKGLTRNPLGIIALFVSLIYGFACLVLSTSISNLHGDSERLPLIWFIIMFPLVILVAFIFLVIKHHEKLYSPSDYRGDESFIQTIDKYRVKEKKLEEVKTLESAPESEENLKEESITETNQGGILQDSAIVDTIPEKKELGEKELLDIYSKTEMWSINELSLKYKIAFKNNVVLSTKHGNFEFDAYAKGPSTTYVVEVKYWQANKSDKKLKLAIQNYLSQTKGLEGLFKRPGYVLKIIVVLVYDSLKDVNKADIIEFTHKINKDAIIEFFDFNELKRSYG